jgi:hypothetical protein
MSTATGRRRAAGSRRDSPWRRGSAPGIALDSGTPWPVGAVAAAAFGAFSRLRGARIFHPDGVGYAGQLRITQPQRSYAGVPLLERAGVHPALFRFSRGAGLPEPLPDVLGVALRLPHVHGRGRHQDFLLVSSVDLPVLHHLLLPGLGGFFGQSFSSVLVYRIADKIRLVGAEPVAPSRRDVVGAMPKLVAAAEHEGLRFRLTLAGLTGRWHAVGELEVGERLPDEEAERLAFTPWNSGGGIRPSGPLMGIRRAAYRASQRGRGLQASEIP